MAALAAGEPHDDGSGDGQDRAVLEAIWTKILDQLVSEFGQNVFDSWFKRLKLNGREGDEIILSVPTRFLRTWIRDNYLKRITALWQEALPSVHSVELKLRSVERVIHAAKPDDSDALSHGAAHATNNGNAAEDHGRRASGMPLLVSRDARRVANQHPGSISSSANDLGFSGAPLDPRLKFETFCTSRGNQMARAAALDVASATAGAPPSYNPLFIHGGIGRGKTHLLHAIAHEVQRIGTRRVVHFSAEQFMLSFVAAARGKDTISFKNRLRGIDMMLIDDLQFLQGNATRREFGETLNALIELGKQIVVVADRAPSKLEGLDERLRSRLAGGLVVEIAAPDYTQRLDILKRRVESLRDRAPGLAIPDQSLEFIAKQVVSNGREIEGAVNRLIHYAVHVAQPGEVLSVELIEGLIRDLMAVKETQPIRIDLIQKVVARECGISLEDLLSARRTRAIVLPRQKAMYLAKTMTLRSLPDIGRRFGGRDHTTVLHAVRKIEKCLKDDAQLAEEVGRLRSLIEEIAKEQD